MTSHPTSPRRRFGRPLAAALLVLGAGVALLGDPTGTTPRPPDATAAGPTKVGSAVAQGRIGTTFAGAGVQFDLVTHGDDQYATFFDVHGDIVLKHRTLNPESAWTTRTIRTKSYVATRKARGRIQAERSFSAKWDTHNWLRLGVDGSGNVHLAGDMHNVPIRYWRTSTPGNLDTLTRVRHLVSPAQEQSTTYPEFINRRNGNLGWLIFRNGRSGNGDTFVYRWHNRSQRWTKTSQPFEATSPTLSDGTGSAYWEVFPTLDGWFHIVYNWREAGDVNSNSRLSYVKTRNFRDYVTVTGTRVAAPLTAATTSTLVDALPAVRSGDTWKANGLINNEYQFLTMGHHTLLAYAKNARLDNGSVSRQLWLARPNGAGGWTRTQLTADPSGVSGVGNNYPDNWVIARSYTKVAVDYGYYPRAGRPTRRVAFRLDRLHEAPFPSHPAPAYFPLNVYPALDAFPGATIHTKTDSRALAQTGGIANRNYLASRPADRRTMYVMSWLAGPDVFNPPSTAPSAAAISRWPARPVRVHKVTYPRP